MDAQSGSRGQGVVGGVIQCDRIVFYHRLSRTLYMCQPKGVLTGGIAHDFNNLLAAILANAQLALLDLADDAPVRVSVEQIQQASRRAAELTIRCWPTQGAAASSWNRWT
jgi:signal transduction histidine kinase